MRMIALALALAGCSSEDEMIEPVSADEANALNDAAEMLEERPARSRPAQPANAAVPTS